MRGIELFVQLRSTGYRLFQKPNGRLGIRGPRPLSADVMAEVRRLRGELLELVAISDAGVALHQEGCARNAKSPGTAPSDNGCHTEPPRANGSGDGNGSSNGNSFPPIPIGWPRAHWVERLRYVADQCESLVPDRAEWLRQWAGEVEQG